jgi:peptidoglycan L-alanyl-D-glutamate endopeptidase CwlK
MFLLVPPTLAAPAWSSDLADLDPAFRARVDRVVSRLVTAGYAPVASCTFRSADTQDLLYGVAPGVATRAKGGQSCHNHAAADGSPAAWAADLWNGGMNLGILAGLSYALDAQVPFLRALGAAARAEGVAWGGDWSHRPGPWADRGLGWDPAHLEDRRCSR